MMTYVLGRDRFSPENIVAIARGAARLAMPEGTSERWEKARAFVERRVKDGLPIYGVSTGFGASCENEIPAGLAAELSTNLYRYHGCGQGPLLADLESAAVLVCRLAQLAEGWSGMRPETLAAMVALLDARVLPCIPAWGSVGASGDLTPLSYVAAVLSGEREATFRGEKMTAKAALENANLAPITLAAKESLSIMNGTSVMTALACLGFERARTLTHAHAAVTALVSFAMRGNPSHFDARLFAAKPHAGSVQYASNVRSWLGVSEHPAARAAGVVDGRIQDPYSVRCSPHVVGVLADALTSFEGMLTTEINGAGDNPLIDPDTGDVLHGGNFYGGHVGFICDTLKSLVASAAEVHERQVILLNQPRTSGGLPENLVLASSGSRTAHHGFKAMEILASSLVADALRKTMPASSFSRSTEGHNQDKVPMGAHAARDLGEILDLSESVLVIALLAACQGVDARNAARELPKRLSRVYERVRALVSTNTADRRQDVDLDKAITAYREGTLGLERGTNANEAP